MVFDGPEAASWRVALVPWLLLLWPTLGGVARADAPAPRAVEEMNGLGLPPALEAALVRGRFEGTTVGFRMLALSFIADGCAAQGDEDPSRRAAARRCVERAFQQAAALGRSNPGKANDGLWLSHLNLILGAADRLGPCLDEPLHRATSQTLHDRSLRERTSHAASFSSSALRWPADQSATLASLRRYDRAHPPSSRAPLSDEPIERWRRFMRERATHAGLGLPWSEATGKAPHAREPRGCALTMETVYLREVDDALAHAWWGKVKQHYLVERVALVGFREWPPGVEAPGDSDSGPVVRGVGAAATAFGLPAARVMGDGVLAARLSATASMVAGAARFDKALERAAHTTLAEAIRFLGAHAHR